MKRVLVCALGMLLLTASAFAADVDGKWSGLLDSPMGPVTIGFTFKADGATLTGTYTGPDGVENAIKDGKIDGANISFTVAIDFGGMPLVLEYKGVVSGEEIKMTLDFMGMPFEFSAKKAK